MDQFFKEAFLNAIKLAVDEDDLPMDSGKFYSEYILLGRSEGKAEPREISGEAMARAAGYVDYLAGMLDRVTAGLAVGQAEGIPLAARQCTPGWLQSA